MTTYYVDSTNGNDSWTGTHSTPQNGDGPWATIGKFIQATRSAGDILWVRRNMTYVEALKVGLSSGTAAAHIVIQGDDGSVPAWTGDDDVRPIVDFNSASAAWVWSSRRYWELKNLEIVNSAYTGECVQFVTNSLGWIENCYFHDNANGAILCDNSSVYIKDFECDDDAHKAIQGIRGYLRIEDARVDGTTGSGEGYVFAGGVADLIDSSSGVTVENAVSDVFLSQPGCLIRARNLKCGSDGATLVVFGSSAFDSALHVEDWQGVKGAHKSFYWQGTVEKDTGVLHSGGAGSSAKVLPGANCCADHPLTLADSFCQGDFQVWCPASESTITIYIRDCGTWTTPPDNTELYVVAEYWDGATAKRVESTKSTQVLDGSNWVAFTTTFTPNAAGWVYVKVYLKLYEDDGDGVYVDVKPVLS